MCQRLNPGGAPCPRVHPGRPQDWCPECRDDLAAWDAAFPGLPLDEDAARQAAWDAQFDGCFPPAEAAPPCPLEEHQAQAFADWLALGDRPAWSLEQVSRPSPN